MGKSKKDRRGVVFSTDPGFDYDYDAFEEQVTLPPAQQSLTVSHDRKQRKGKVVTLIDGFVGTEEDVRQLEKLLKARCGVGGSSRKGDILLQGAIRDKVAEILRAEGYPVKFKGGE